VEQQGFVGCWHSGTTRQLPAPDGLFEGQPLKWRPGYFPEITGVKIGKFLLFQDFELKTLISAVLKIDDF
jgi:hypothetical protein